MADTKRGNDSDAGGASSAADAVAEPAVPVRVTSPAWPRYRSWLEKPAAPVPNRHAAITRTLYSWSNYTSWADKVRSDWDKDA